MILPEMRGRGVVLVAVNGIPGAGKSSIYAKLKSLGYDAWDTDADGLSEWRDRATKAAVAEPADWHDPVETRAIEYRVRRDRVAALHDRARDHVVYLCGCAGGEEEFWDLLDLVICVSIDDDTLRQRLATRTTNDYGKAPHELASILAANATWADDYARFGAVVIDGTKPLDEVVAEVVRVAEAAGTRGE